MDEHEQRVHDEARVEAEAREAEVLVDEQEHEPEADDQAFLGEEGAGSDVQEEVHHGVGFLAAAGKPQQREEGVAHIQQEDREQEHYVAPRVAVDVARPVALATTLSPSPRCEPAAPRSGGLGAAVSHASIDPIPDRGGIPVFGGRRIAGRLHASCSS
ncbi:MAG: hypothetical protein CL931_16370 [Deltaproteobacteria bacterium]|nr:hypothetical protein [Deltaproteobacteria bacterium]